MQIIIQKNLISYQFFLNNSSEFTLLFLHGWRSSKEVWNQVASSMQQVASIYAIDLPGFGGSPAPNPRPNPLPEGEVKKAWSVGDYAEIVKGFIEKLELKNVIIIGHSFGGRVGIKLASNPHPLPEGEGRVRGLVLVDSAGFAVLSNRKNFIAGAAKIIGPFFRPKFMQPLRRQIYKAIGAEDYLATPELQQTFVNIVNEDLTEDMRRINIPTLIVWGENDKETPIEFGQRMNSLIHNSKFIILKNAGHYSFLDKPKEFVKILTDFISDPNAPN